MTKFLNNQLRGEGFISMHSFSLQSLGSVASGPLCAEAEHHGGRHMVEEARCFTSWWLGSKETERGV